MDKNSFLNSLSNTTNAANVWFLKNSKRKNKADWNSHGGLHDSGIGAVYAFFDSSNNCLYVGQTTLKLKERAQVDSSRHYDTEWWPKWETLRFLNISDQTDQIVLEVLLILALSPSWNKKPGPRDVIGMFPDSE
jgi:hypothetical protein